LHSFVATHHKRTCAERKKEIKKDSEGILRDNFHFDRITHPERSLVTHDLRFYEPLNEDAVGFASGLADPLVVYRFNLGGYTVLTKSAGVINSFLAADPSASGWNSPEWSSLSSLFSEFKLVSLSARITANYNVKTTTTNTFGLGVCSNLGTATNPGSYAAIADNADAIMYSYTDTGRHRDNASGYTHTMHATQINWSEVATPTTTPYAGAPGSIQFYSDNGVASGGDTAVFQVLIRGIYDFRIRV
jgi:hypothetical protein